MLERPWGGGTGAREIGFGGRCPADPPARPSALLFLSAFIFLLPVFAPQARAATSNGTGGGNWSDAAAWNPAAVPTSADTVTVLSGDTITIDISTATASTTTVSGVLSFSSYTLTQFTLVQGSMTVAAGGTLSIGTAANPSFRILWRRFTKAILVISAEVP